MSTSGGNGSGTSYPGVLVARDTPGNFTQGVGEITVLTNSGAEGNIAITLPAIAAIGQVQGVIIDQLQDIHIFPPAGGTIAKGAVPSLAATPLQGAAGCTIVLIASSLTNYDVMSYNGDDMMSNASTPVWQNYFNAINVVGGLSLFAPKNKATGYTTTGQDCCLRFINNAGGTWTLGSQLNQVLIIQNQSTGVLTLTPGTSIDLPTVPPKSTAMIICTNANGTWVTLFRSGGTNTAATAIPTTPALGAAAQVNTNQDVEIYLDVTVAGQLTIAIGPTVGVGNTIFSGTAGVGLNSFRVPAGWYVAVTTSNTATWTAVAVPC